MMRSWMHRLVKETTQKIAEKRQSSSKAWISRHINDQFVKKAKSESLRSRSHFKLTEIQEKYKIISSSSLVLDLGAAPGGWSLAASKILDPSKGGLLCAVDLLSMENIPNAHILQGDFCESDIQSRILKCFQGRLADVILSDMLHNTSGHHQMDHFKSIDLCRQVFYFSQDYLKKNGSLLCKYLRGSDEKDFLSELKKFFKEVDIIKPKASRSESSEVYVLARGNMSLS